MKNNTKLLVTTAVLVALTLVFQNLRLLIGTSPVSTYIIGTLVNLCLIIAAMHLGLIPGLFVAVITPLVALIQGYAAANMVPFILLGNVVLVLLFALFARKKENRIVYFLIGGIAAMLKFAVIALGMALMVTSLSAPSFMAGLAIAIQKQLQQLITAAIATVIALPVLAGLKRAKV